MLFWRFGNCKDSKGFYDFSIGYIEAKSFLWDGLSGYRFRAQSFNAPLSGGLQSAAAAEAPPTPNPKTSQPVKLQSQ